MEVCGSSGRFSLRVRQQSLAPAFLAVCLFVARFSLSPAAAEGQPPEYTTLWNRGDYREALRTLDALIRERGEPIPIRWLADRAELRCEIGQLDEAVADLENVESRSASSANMLRLALLYRDRGRRQDYLQTLGRAAERAALVIRYQPSAEIVLVQGRIAELQGRNPKTILNSLYSALMEQMPNYVPVFLAAGDLAFRNWDWRLAAEYYEKALKVEAENQLALAGLAECYWKSDDERLRECLERLLKINPNHPRARAIQIEQALDVGDTDKASRILAEALAINPNRMTMLALQSAAWFLLDNPTSLALTQKRALELNRYASEIFRVPGTVASRHYRFREAAEFQRQALERDPDDAAARAYYAFDLLRLGDEEEGRRQLELAFKADPFNATVFNMLNLLDSLKRFETVERGPFALQLPANEATVLANDALTLLDEAYTTYTRKYDARLETPIRVQVFDHHDDFMVRSVGLPGSVGHLGICFGRLVTMDSPSARPKWEANWRSVLWHEFVHVVTLQKTKNRIPRWLSEGISVFEETQRDTAWGQRLNPQYKTLVEHEPLPGVTELEACFTSPKTMAHLMFGYLVAGEFVRFYTERYGFAALNRTLDRIGSGQAAVGALAESAGVSRENLDGEFQTYFKKRLAPFDALPPAETSKSWKPGRFDRGTSATLSQAEWAALPSPFTDAMRAAAAALEAKEWDKAEAALQKAHGLFPDYQGADAPLRQLISLYERLNRREELLATLRQEIHWNSTDFPSHRQLVGLLEQDQAWPEMTRVAENALGIDPFDAAMRLVALKGYQKTGNMAKVLEIQGQLIRLEPAHAVAHRLQRIETLCDMERWAEAKKDTLQLLEETPYYWEGQKMLLRIVEKDSPKPKSDSSTLPSPRVEKAAPKEPE
jgi:tetratricopeptide (TPR) repeat protein